MGIMEVLEELNDPELDETEQAPAQVEETAPAEPEESPVLEEAEAVPGEAGPEPEERTAALPRRKPIRPELIMGIIAAAAAVLLMVTIVLSIPYFGGEDEDPEALADRHSAARATEAVQETILEPTVSETEPENPTIPPDPNPKYPNDIQYNRKNYLLLQNLPSSAGVDVSAYQGDIDWKAVKNSGIEFAIIRLGYRGYESGKLVEDTYAKKNLEGAREAGLKVGAYFFSQALTVKEVDEEIKFMLGILGETYLDMPIVLDWEIPASSARTANMDARTLTDLQLHFCGQMKEKGYQPMVYFNWHQSENLYYLSELEDYPFWLALYQDRMTYPWRVEMWQYSDKGTVPGINGPVDLNVYMPN